MTPQMKYKAKTSESNWSLGLIRYVLCVHMMMKIRQSIVIDSWESTNIVVSSGDSKNRTV